ncbi:alpha1 protein [Hayes Yard virus]|uniref:Alpha1 protein n=1 Tax=Hayes Yard virus TaxID=2602440 RepID=A0A7D0N0Z5_9RHAB|nr:alpha1 protein [Hayes Yard virus]QEA08655.1 alpha1 protein [Hayes Yard virus]
MDTPFRKLWENIKNWGEERGNEIKNWWHPLEWRLKIFGIVVLLLVGSVVLYKVGKLLFYCINCLYKGGNKIRILTKKIRTKRKRIVPHRFKRKKINKHGWNKEMSSQRENVYKGWEETKMY